MDLFGAATVQLHWFGASVQKSKYQLVVSPCLETLRPCEFAAAFQDTHGHIWPSPQIVCSSKRLCIPHWCISVFLTKALHYLRRGVTSPAPSIHVFFLSYLLLMHWKSWFSFFQHAEGLCQERERKRHCQEMSQLCSSRDLTIPSDLLIFGRRSADIKSKMLLLEKHRAVQTVRVQHRGTVT